MEHHNNDELRGDTNLSNGKDEMQKLIIDLVKKKNRGENLAPYTVDEVNFYESGPEELVNGLEQNGDDEWYFLTRRNPVSPGSRKARRDAGGGKWVQNGACNRILHNGAKIGKQRFFEYKRGDETTDWRLHEFEEENPSEGKAVKLRFHYVLCKLYKKSRGRPSCSNKGQREVEKGSSSGQKEESAAKLDNINSQFMEDQNTNPSPNSLSSLPCSSPSFVYSSGTYIDYHQPTPLNATPGLQYSIPFSYSNSGIYLDHHSQTSNANEGHGFPKFPAMEDLYIDTDNGFEDFFQFDECERHLSANYSVRGTKNNQG